MSEILQGAVNAGMAAYLAENIGREVIAEFQCGGDDLVRKAGILTAAQPDYLVLRDDMNLRDVVCSMEHLCFVTFYLAGTLPRNGAQPGETTQQGTEPSTVPQGDSTNNGSSANGLLGAVRPVSSQAGYHSGMMAALNHSRRKGRKTD